MADFLLNFFLYIIYGSFISAIAIGIAGTFFNTWIVFILGLFKNNDSLVMRWESRFVPKIITFLYTLITGGLMYVEGQMISHLALFLFLIFIIEYYFHGEEGFFKPNYDRLENLFKRFDNKFTNIFLKKIKVAQQKKKDLIENEEKELAKKRDVIKQEEKAKKEQEQLKNKENEFLKKHPRFENSLHDQISKIHQEIIKFENEIIDPIRGFTFKNETNELINYWGGHQNHNIQIFPDDFEINEKNEKTYSDFFNLDTDKLFNDDLFEFINNPKLPKLDLNILRIFDTFSKNFLEVNYPAESSLVSEINNKVRGFEEFIKILQNNYKPKLKNTLEVRKKAKLALKEPSKDNVEALARVIDLRYYQPMIMRTSPSFNFDEKSKILLVEYLFPDYEINKPEFGEDSKKLTAKQIDLKVRKALYTVIIRYCYLLSRYNLSDSYNAIAINIKSHWVDKATGQDRSGVIASLFGQVEDFKDLVIYKLDPETTFKKFKGIITPEIDTKTPIKPIYTVNKNDKRIVPTKDVASRVDEDMNLAAMDWEDFESLVAQLFEWEFASQGNEIKVTQASRDKGIDAIMFDPDPIKGGKYVLQAKRYTNVVDVSAVRDLYGTMLNEGANKGIIITTSSYGKDAYEFAKDKPLSLVDGSHLINMLQKHGKKYKIDLAEARKINKLKDSKKA